MNPFLSPKFGPNAQTQNATKNQSNPFMAPKFSAPKTLNNVVSPKPIPGISEPKTGGFMNLGQMKEDWKKTGKGVENILPAVGATVGAIGGGALGTAVAPGFGTYEGAVAGSAAGGAVGEFAKQGLENLFGQKKGIDTKEIGKQGLEMGAMEAVGGPIIKGIGKIISGTGEKLAESAIPTSAVEAKLLQTYKAGKGFFQRIGDALLGKESKAPITAAKTAFDKGLMGTESMIGVQGKRAATNIWDNFLAPQLEKSPVVVDMQSFFKEAEQQIIKETPEISRQKSLLNALESFKEDYANVKTVPIKQLQNFKSGWAEHIPEKAYKGEDIAGAANNVKNTLAGISRSKIYSALGPEAKQAYIDWGNLQGIQELGQKAMTGGKMKGGFGSFWSAIKDMALTPVSTVGGQSIYKVGQGVELVGSPNLRFVRDLFVPSDGQKD